MNRNVFRLTALIGVAVFLGAGFHVRGLVKGTLLALYDLPVYNRSSFPPAAPIEQRLIAHAGGAFHGLTYTNSREALDNSYANGYRIFELDFNWTSDGQLVLVHDWSYTSSLFAVAPHVFTYQEFVHGYRHDGLHGLTFDDLRQWLHAHPDALVVTDTKAPNPRLLDYLARNGRDVLPQLILQIYRLSELHAARTLAPRAVWLTIYKCHYPAWALARISGVDAFAIPVDWYAAYAQPRLLLRTHFYIYSVPADQVDAAFQRLPGIYGIYVN